ncbi:molybdopterin cofactor-binding domain-containing protein [Sphingomonas xanthus]|uniref:Xanthine dehydrogenase family protein molybdopterin-binding subunit n=1 Tax=Sphingomonas xanthus TaxID=2594473 RepID=A0A516IS90_9SPHN|nr:molybdopterin cofactor-binding domain-containing protein [Sphingomonas xanthus]QDP19772.1 xanthine dehydrogenase family protein molybdopterin-binding subunit [Sphingomonas xanthus]
MRSTGVTRRTLLIGGGAGVGLILAYLVWPKREGSPLRGTANEALFGAFLKIALDGRVTLVAPQAEVGQGIWTGLAQIAADELGAAWESMAVEPAPHNDANINRLVAREIGVETRITAGSSSIRAFEEPVRSTAATARALLCAAAAARWNVRARECDTAGGFVIHEGKRLAFGEVAAAAAAMRPPDQPAFRVGATNRLIGIDLPRLDLPAKSDGSLRFAGDVRLPGMLFASVRLAPPRGRLVGFSRQAGERQMGLVDLLARDGWIAAIGDSWWAADRALARAAPKFEGPSPADPHVLLQDALKGGDAIRLVDRGDYDAATEDSRPLAATYSVAATAHYGLELPAAVARFTGERLEIWSGTQVPDLVRQAAADAARLKASDVTVYAMPVGDGSGRAVEVEVVAIAVELARHTKRAVSLTLPPATAQNSDPVRPPAIARLTALPSPDGRIAAWKARVASTSGLLANLARAKGGEPPAFAPSGAAPPYGIDAIRVEAIDAALPIRTGYMRGGDAAAHIFFTESFIDEMALAMGAEPLAFRIGMLGGATRLARALSTAAALGGWDGGGRGSTMGLACASLYGSHIGLLAEANIGADQRIAVSRLVAAVDAGRMVNPGLVRQQVEGGLLAALAAATIPAPEFIAGMPRARPMRGMGFERLDQVPRVEIELIANDGPAGGVSGLGIAVLAPAVANAIYAGTGRRLRNLPFDPMSG